MRLSREVDKRSGGVDVCFQAGCSGKECQLMCLW